LQQAGIQSSVSGGAMQAEQGTTGINPIFSFLRGKKKAKPTLDVSTQQSSDDTRCSIPGCKQFVYVDEEGVRSDFCSLRHREYDVPSLSFFREAKVLLPVPEKQFRLVSEPHVSCA